MRITTLFLAFISCLALGYAPIKQAEANEEQIAVIVNDDAISTSDVNDRLDMVLSSSNLPNTRDIREKLIDQVLNNLIEEQLKMQEAARLKLDITEDEVQNGFNAIAKQNNMDPDTFRQVIKQQNVNESTIKRQVRAEIAWSKVTQSELRPKINISQKDIDSALNRMHSNEGKTEFLVAEIFLPVEDNKSESNVRQLATRLISEIKSGQAPFFKVAQQFSKAAGATNGGDLGWVSEDQLPEEISKAINGLEKNTISDPVRSLNGYHILLVRDTRTITAETIPDREQVSTGLGMQRLERLQERRFMDLKSQAFIEKRV